MIHEDFARLRRKGAIILFFSLRQWKERAGDEIGDTVLTFTALAVRPGDRRRRSFTESEATTDLYEEHVASGERELSWRVAYQIEQWLEEKL